jgi:uncharacterized protein YvpB
MDQASLVRRRSAPIQMWFILGVVSVSAIACALMGLVAWKEAEQIQGLQAQIETLREERQTTDGLIGALQGTATAMEDRLSTLEANDPAQQLAALQEAMETASDSEELSTLRTSMGEIQTRVDGFQSVLDDLAARMAVLEPTVGWDGESLPTEVRLTVARQQQSHNLSCEASAASMVAQYHGLNVSEADVLQALPLNSNPHLGFRGNVDGPTGDTQDYGVYAGPVMEILNHLGLHAWLVEGGLEGIKAAIARGNPVIAWVTYDCLPSTPVETEIDGRTVKLVPNQHVVVVTGYSAQGVWANDPWDGQEDFYPFEDLGRAMDYFGDMAIEIAAP